MAKKISIRNIVVGAALVFIGAGGVVAYDKYNTYGLVRVLTKVGCVDLGPPNGRGAIDPYITRGYSCGDVIIAITK